MKNFCDDFIKYSIDNDVLLFGEFITKAGRDTPYFFNAGRFNDGVALKVLGGFYVSALRDAGWEFDMLFGPAYKGIPLATSVALAYADQGRKVPITFNRKEVKDHGEGGRLIGAPIRGKVVVIDDVISAGTSIRESIELIRAEGGEVAGLIVALDRGERGVGYDTAAQEIQRTYGVPVTAIAAIDDLVGYLERSGKLAVAESIRGYLQRWGAQKEK